MLLSAVTQKVVAFIFRVFEMLPIFYVSSRMFVVFQKTTACTLDVPLNVYIKMCGVFCKVPNYPMKPI